MKTLNLIYFSLAITGFVILSSCSDDLNIQPNPMNSMCVLDSITYQAGYQSPENVFYYTYNENEKIKKITCNCGQIEHFYYSDHKIDSIQTFKNGKHTKSVLFSWEKTLIHRYEIYRHQDDHSFNVDSKIIFHLNSKKEIERVEQFRQSETGTWVMERYMNYTWKNGNFIKIQGYRTVNKKSESPQDQFNYLPGWKYIKETVGTQNYSVSNSIRDYTVTYTYDNMKNPLNNYQAALSYDYGWLFPGKNNMTSAIMIQHQTNNEVGFDVRFSYLYNEEKYPVQRIISGISNDTLSFYYSCR